MRKDGSMITEETDLTLYEQGLDAVGSWLKQAIAEGGPENEPPYPATTGGKTRKEVSDEEDMDWRRAVDTAHQG